MSRFSKLTDQRFVRYLLVGLGVYLFEILIILSSQQVLGLSAVAAVAVSFWLGLIISFILTKIVTFQDTRKHHKVLIIQFLGYSLLTLWNFGFTIGFTQLFHAYLSAVWCRTITLAITVGWNYFIYQTKIFQPQKGNT